MLRLLPSAVPRWRSPTCLQLGAEAAVVIDDVPPWAERLVDALRSGIPDAFAEVLAVDAGATASEVRMLLTRLAPVLEPPPSAPPPLSVSFAAEVGAPDRDLVVAALRDAGARLTETADAASVALLVSAHLCDPRRAAALMSQDVPHLPLELSGDRVTAGPLTVPGRTACQACRHEHRRDADPLWPTVAAQLLVRTPPPSDPALLVAACAWAVRLVSEPVASATRSVTLRRQDAGPTWDVHEPHPRCWCRSPGRSATSDARSVPTSEPTSVRGFARPA